MAVEKHYHFILPVWGEKYTKLFIDVSLPMLLMQGGLDAGTYTSNDQFLIITTWESFCTIKASSSYKRLKKLIAVKFILIDGLIDLTRVYDAASHCYALAMSQENIIPGKTYFILLTPDSFWSEGTFKHIFELAGQGFPVVMAFGLRIDAEKMSRDLGDLRAKNNDSVSLSKDVLIPLLVDNLHPLSNDLNWLSPVFRSAWPSHLYWVNKKDKQLFAHCFHLHPLMVMASEKTVNVGVTIDDEFVKNLNYPFEKYYICQNDFFAIELSAADRSWPQSLEKRSIKKVIEFSKVHANKLHRHFFNHRISLTTSGSTIAPELDLLIKNVVNKIPCSAKGFRAHLIYNPLYLFFFKTAYRVNKVLKIIQRFAVKLKSRLESEIKVVKLKQKETTENSAVPYLTEEGNFNAK